MKYWIMQTVAGRVGAIGPYASQSARDKRLAVTTGGDKVEAYRSEETDKDLVIQEYKQDGTGD